LIEQVLELRYSYIAVRQFIAKQTADFYRLCQEESLSAAAASTLAARYPAIIAQAITTTQQRDYSYSTAPIASGSATAADTGIGMVDVARAGASHLMGAARASSTTFGAASGLPVSSPQATGPDAGEEAALLSRQPGATRASSSADGNRGDNATGSRRRLITGNEDDRGTSDRHREA
jgi:hypothetical protein